MFRIHLSDGAGRSLATIELPDATELGAKVKLAMFANAFPAPCSLSLTRSRHTIETITTIEGNRQ